MNPVIEQQLRELGFDDEKLAKLRRYAELIKQWNKAINLVAPSTLPQLWERHLLDSAQLWPIIAKLPQSRIIDLGSGGGLPGIVLAIAGAEHVTMVESDTRKCVFLREVSRETKLANVTVINERIEKVSGITAPVITARALASLRQLVIWASPLLEESGQMVFLKGAGAEAELQELSPELSSKAILKQSITDKQARIVQL